MSYEYHHRDNNNNNYVESMDIEPMSTGVISSSLSSYSNNNNSNGILPLPLPLPNTMTNPINGGHQYIREQLKLWVGNLPDGVTENEIRDIFSKYPIESVKLAENSSQQPCAFISFYDRDIATLAREELSHTTYKGSRLKINWASIKPSKHSLSLSNSSNGTIAVLQPIDSTPPPLQPPQTTTTTTSFIPATPPPTTSSPPPLPPTTSSPPPLPPQPQSKIIHDPYTGRQYTSYPQYHSVYYGSETSSNSSVNNNKTTSPPTTASPPPLSHSQSTLTASNNNSISNNNNQHVHIKDKVTDSDPYVNRKLFIGAFSDNETTEDMRRTFSKFGEVDDVMITSKGVAFIRFIKTESSILAKRDLGLRYKISYDKREPRDNYHYDPNGPFSGSNSGYQYYNDYQYKQPPLSSSLSSLPPLPPPSQTSPFNEPLSSDEYNQFYSLLENLKPTKSLIRESKDWFILHLKSGRAIIQLMNRYINTSMSANKIEVIYLINDLIYFGSVRRTHSLDIIDPISELFEPLLPSIISSFYKEPHIIQQKLYQVLEIWEVKKYYPFKTIHYFRSFINNPIK